MDLFDNTPKSVYNSFNDFIFTDETKVFGKLVARSLFVAKTRTIPGDIVECGVFKGSGMMTFLKLKKIWFPHSIKRVIGFDFFETEKLLETISGVDAKEMGNLFESRDFKHGVNSLEEIHGKISDAGFTDRDFELVRGDLKTTASEYVSTHPGFKISLLYMDVDLKDPTHYALRAFWDRVSIGGVVLFDEYAYHKWSESAGADEFFKDKGVVVRSLDYICPTAYVIKER